MVHYEVSGLALNVALRASDTLEVYLSQFR